MRRLSGLTLLAVILCLSACAAFQRSDDAQAAKTQMIGLSREDVLACMGPPKKKSHEGSTEVWTFLSTDGQSDTKSAKQTISGTSVGASSHSKSFCTVNVVMKDGIVKAVHYTGPSGSMFTPNEQCGYAVENCVNPAAD